MLLDTKTTPILLATTSKTEQKQHNDGDDKKHENGKQGSGKAKQSKVVAFSHSQLMLNAPAQRTKRWRIMIPWLVF